MPNETTKNDDSQKAPPFSDRQIEIITQWADAKSASEASLNLGIAEHTYRTHLKRMRAKLKVNRTFDVYRHLLERELL